MFVQAAIDTNRLDRAVTYAATLASCPIVDIIEVGSPLVQTLGVTGVTEVIRVVDASHIYLDLKMLDFPQLEIELYLSLGINRFSALVGMDDSRLRELASIRDELHIDVFMSTMGYPLECIRQRTEMLCRFDFRKIVCHGSGATREAAFAQSVRYLEMLADVVGIELIAAGGIERSNATKLGQYNLAGIIIGRGLSEAKDPCTEAAVIKRAIDVGCGQ